MGGSDGTNEVRRPVTLRDVARASAVSVPTASKVLNGHGNVSPETRRRIFEAVERLDFRPNALAKSFALGRSFTVGVLAQKASGNFSSPVITGILDALSKNDIAALVYDDQDRGEVRPNNIRALQARRADGVIVVGDGTDFPFPSISRSFECPVVHVFGASDSPDDLCLLPDDEMAGALAAEHLIAQGRTKIVHVTAMEESSAVRARCRGVTTALEQAGLPLAFGSPFYGDWSTPWGYRAGTQLLARMGEFDAIICGNDYIAYGISRAFERAGVDIPLEVSITGYDNWTKYSGSPDNYLTSIDPLLNDLGHHAAMELLNRNTGKAAGGIEYRPTVLIEGLSTGTEPIPPEVAPIYR